MKNVFPTLIGSSLLATTVLVAASLPAQAASLTAILTDQTNVNTANYPTVKVTLDDAINTGAITVKVDVVPGVTGYIGDLRGVFFNLPSFSNLTIASISGGPLTATSTNGNFDAFSNSALLQGVNQSFNVGVEVGSQGIAQGDDYQTTTFTIAGTGLTLSSFSSQAVGARLMSVGSPTGSRDLSSKLAGTFSTVTPPDEDPVSVPEPTALAGLGLVAAAMGASRHRKSAQKA